MSVEIRGSTDPLKCPECGAAFTRKQALGSHRAYRHLVVGPFSSRPRKEKKDAPLGSGGKEKEGSRAKGKKKEPTKATPGDGPTAAPDRPVASEMLKRLIDAVIRLEEEHKLLRRENARLQQIVDRWLGEADSLRKERMFRS